MGVLLQNDNINTQNSDSEFRLVVMAGAANEAEAQAVQRIFDLYAKRKRILESQRAEGFSEK